MKVKFKIPGSKAPPGKFDEVQSGFINPDAVVVVVVAVAGRDAVVVVVVAVAVVVVVEVRTAGGAELT